MRDAAGRNITVRSLNARGAAAHACLPAGAAECNATVALEGAAEGLQILEVLADGAKVCSRPPWHGAARLRKLSLVVL